MPVLPTPMLLRPCILKRAMAALPGIGKDIELLYFNAVPDSDSSDTVIVRYDFNNALWYTLDDVATTESRHVMVRPGGTEQKTVSLTVHGLFRKSNYTIIMEPGGVSILPN